MKEMWDERYSSKEYVYGKSPNKFLKETVDKLESRGKILFVGEGEGRNAVYAAKIGFQVYAYDFSIKARDKALKYSKEENVLIKYFVGEIDDLKFKKAFFDVVALIFVHFPLNLREIYHQKIGELIKPGGLIILEGFSEDNLKYRRQNPSIGGPNNKGMLFSKKIIRNDFTGFNVIMLDEIETELNEGIFHKGIGKVIRFIGEKSKK